MYQLQSDVTLQQYISILQWYCFTLPWLTVPDIFNDDFLSD